jgi:hypothetical protein
MKFDLNKAKNVYILTVTSVALISMYLLVLSSRIPKPDTVKSSIKIEYFTNGHPLNVFTVTNYITETNYVTVTNYITDTFPPTISNGGIFTNRESVLSYDIPLNDFNDIANRLKRILDSYTK